MRELHFEANELIYRAGDKAESAFIIRQGEIEITWPGAHREAERLGPGEMFGHVGIMIDQPRRRTARALSDVTVLAITRSDFLAAFNERYVVIEPFMRRVFASLHDTARLAEHGAPPPSQLSAERHSSAAASPVPSEDSLPPIQYEIRLVPASDILVEQIGETGVPVESLPFRIGRQPSRGESLPPGGLDLTLHDQKPFNLSRRHFVIESGADGPLVRDIGSHLGTIVNGKRIGGSEVARAIALRPGDNVVVAGSESSPFVFTIRVSAP